MENEKQILEYRELLEKIEGEENHLLIANGFNYGLAVGTGYKEIFDKMIEKNKGVYKEAQSLFEKCGYDLELFLEEIRKDISKENVFLTKYVNNKIKLDFMQALHEIVKSKIKNIYAEKNEGIFLLLNKFTNYFTLNYDPFLYMFLLKHKISKGEKDSLVIQPSLPYIQEDIDTQHNNLYTEIKQLRDNGLLVISVESDPSSRTESELMLLTKTQFVSALQAYSKKNNKEWKQKDINRVVDRILEEENRNKVLEKIDDGSRQLCLFGDEFVFTYPETQNLFFLHGAFHIYRDGKSIKKITQDTDASLYNKLEEILNEDNKDIVCVFQTKDKLDAINSNEYLTNCYNKLSTLSGNMVIIGSSLADNDDHIFSQINNSNIQNVFVSSIDKNLDEYFELAKRKFNKKKVYMLRAETISYEKVD
jgi:hypothetical protein